MSMSVSLYLPADLSQLVLAYANPVVIWVRKKWTNNEMCTEWHHFDDRSGKEWFTSHSSKFCTAFVADDRIYRVDTDGIYQLVADGWSMLFAISGLPNISDIPVAVRRNRFVHLFPASSQHFEVDLHTQHITVHASLPFAMPGVQHAVALDDFVYAIGVIQLWCFDARKKEWCQKCQMNDWHAKFSMTCFQNRLFVVSSLTGASEIYNASEDRWCASNTLTRTRCGGNSMFVLQDRLLCMDDEFRTVAMWEGGQGKSSFYWREYDMHSDLQKHGPHKNSFLLSF